MADVQRDSDDMRTMAAALQSLRDTFATVAATVDEERPIFGDADVGNAYRGFATNWSDARKTLDQEIEGAVATLNDIAAVYDQLEGQIAASARSDSGPPAN